MKVKKNVKKEENKIDYEDKYKRLLAEYSNFAKQKEAEVASTIAFANKNLISRILDILDDIDAGINQETTPEDTKNILEILKSKLEHTLTLENVEEIKLNPGDVYSAEDCEVVQAVDDPENSGKILQVLRKGYKISGKILRTAKVIVGK